MNIGIKKTPYLDSTKQPAIKEINDSINWGESIEGEGFEAYLETTKKVVGYVELIKEDEFLFINHLAVHKNYQGKGIGTILFKEVLATAQEEHSSSVTLFSVTQKSNSFYMRCAEKLQVNYAAEESGSIEDPDGSMYFRFFLDENTPPLQRALKPRSNSFFGFY